MCFLRAVIILALLLFKRNIPRQQLPNVLLQIHIRRCLQNVKQIPIRIQPILFLRLNHAEDDRAAPDAAGCVGKQEILPVNDKGLDASFGAVVADFQSAVFRIIQSGMFIAPANNELLYRMQTAAQHSGFAPSSKRRPELVLPSSAAGYIVLPDCTFSAYPQ